LLDQGVQSALDRGLLDPELREHVGDALLSGCLAEVV